MSDTQAAMREFRFLDEKRKTNGLTQPEETRWQELGASLGIDLSASLQPQPAGYYGEDGLWYAYPAGYDPHAAWQQQQQWAQQEQQPQYYPAQQGYYDPNTGAYYPPQPQQQYTPQYGAPAPQGYYDPNTGAYYPPESYAQPSYDPAEQQQYDPSQQQYDPSQQQSDPSQPPQQQWGEAPPAPVPPQQWQQPAAPEAEPWQAQPAWQQPSAPPAPLPPAPVPAPKTSAPVFVPFSFPVKPAVPAKAPPTPVLEEVGGEDVMEISDEEVLEVPVTAPSPSSREPSAPAPRPLLSLDSVDDLRGALLDDDAPATLDSTPLVTTSAGGVLQSTTVITQLDAATANLLSQDAEVPSAEFLPSLSPVEAEPPAPHATGFMPSLDDLTIGEPEPLAPPESNFEPAAAVVAADAGPDLTPGEAEPLAAVVADDAMSDLSVDVEVAAAPAVSAEASSWDAPMDMAQETAPESPVAAAVVTPEPVALSPEAPAAVLAREPVALQPEAVPEPLPSVAVDVDEPSVIVAPEPVEAPPEEPRVPVALAAIKLEPVPAQPTKAWSATVPAAAPQVNAERTPISLTPPAAPNWDDVPVVGDAVAPVESSPDWDDVPVVGDAVEAAAEASTFSQPATPAAWEAPIAEGAAEVAPLPASWGDSPEPAASPSSFAAATREVSLLDLSAAVPAGSLAREASSWAAAPMAAPPFVAASAWASDAPVVTAPATAWEAPAAQATSAPDGPVVTAPATPWEAPMGPVAAAAPAAQSWDAPVAAAAPAAQSWEAPVAAAAPAAASWDAPVAAATPGAPSWDAPTEEASPAAAPVDEETFLEATLELEADVVEEPAARVSSGSAFDMLAMPPESAPRIPTFAKQAPSPAPAPRGESFASSWEAAPVPVETRGDPPIFGTAWDNSEPASPAIEAGLTGPPSDRIELASPADFIQAPATNDAVGIEADMGEFVVESASLAALATHVSEGGPSSIDDGKLELARNADFIDNTQLTGTGLSWSDDRNSIPLEGEEDGEVIQGMVLEEEAPPEADSWGVAVSQPSPAPVAVAPPPAAVRSPPPAAPAPRAVPSLGPAPALQTRVAVPVAAPPAVSAVPVAGPGASAPSLTAVTSSGGVPVLVPGEHRVILHTVEGQVKRGAIKDAKLGDPQVQLQLANGGTESVPRERVKALFFMLAPGARAPSTEGNKVRVTFKDGRQVAGFSKDHKGATSGFFVVPADNRTNTERIFIFRHAIQSISVDS